VIEDERVKERKIKNQMPDALPQKSVFGKI